MGRKAISIDDQVLLLKKRGLEFDFGESKGKEILADIGYYRLGFYWHHFQVDADHNLAAGTKFSDVKDLYYLDVDLRNIFAKYLNRIEVNFRTNLIYIVSNKHKGSPTWFADRHIVNSSFTTSLGKFYNPKFVNNNKCIRDHHQKYINDIYAPAWKTLEFMSFGFNLKLYSSIKDSNTKSEIAYKYKVIKVSKFLNHIKGLVSLRNICAHGSTLYDYSANIGIGTIPDFNIKNDERKKLSGFIKLVSYYIGIVSENRKTDFDKEIKKTLKNPGFSAKVKEIIETKSAYK